MKNLIIILRYSIGTRDTSAILSIKRSENKFFFIVKKQNPAYSINKLKKIKVVLIIVKSRADMPVNEKSIFFK